MKTEYEIKGIADKVRQVRKAIQDLKNVSDGFPAIERNVNRIMADVRVLELDIVDLAEILAEQEQP